MGAACERFSGVIYRRARGVLSAISEPSYGRRANVLYSIKVDCLRLVRMARRVTGRRDGDLSVAVNYTHRLRRWSTLPLSLSVYRGGQAG
ncbi:hypothetical protein KCP76_22270 [Salmonella enterica subsp. enterica serovar Weltevreden]|nr:hypothetical protein KCP76_22270 [Salmonella enterica subsp. enterica serovar Weltevreden]